MGSENKSYRKQLVLVGGGHSHALLIRKLALAPIAGVKIVLVTNTYHVPYSGMLPGYLAGIYHFDESHIDLYRLCSWAGVEFVHASVDGIAALQKRIFLKERPSISYDVLSIDIGSTPKMDDVPGAITYATGIKPVPQFLKVFNGMVKGMETGKLSAQSVVIVGGGAAGVEVALGLRRRLASEHKIHLVHKEQDILNDKANAARKKFRAVLADSGVELHLNSPVLNVEKGALQLPSRRLNYDYLYWMTQASAPTWLKTSGLALDDRGFILVNDTLQTLDHDDIFASGDVAAVRDYPRPKAGVFAVRQAEPLTENIRLYVAGLGPAPFKPQAKFLAIIGTSDGQAVAMRGRLVTSGAWVWRWKERIDRKFMRQFADLSVLTVPAEKDCANAEAQLRWVADVKPFDTTTAKPGRKLCQFAEVFPAIVDDPFLLGNLAVHHCANEIFASGGTIQSATANLQVPANSGCVLEHQQSLLMSGMRSCLIQLGANLSPGHVSSGPVLKVGLTVSGSSEVGHELLKSGMAKGDLILLSKPLGTGLIFAAARQLKTKGRWVEAAIQSMLRPGSLASAVALRFDASSCGHVSKTGLAGLLAEMILANEQLGKRLSVRLNLSELSLLKGAIESLSLGIECVEAASNVVYVGERVTLRPSKKSQELFPILFDPQTAGGLLFTVGKEFAASALKELHAQGDRGASIIGVVEEHDDPQILVD